eukprot:Skav223053  [mRNA]  locus=scaffold1069:338833:342747:- [translate_table: standard]
MSRGLQCPDGMLVSVILGVAGTMNIQTVVMENVPGICKHEDFKTIIAEAKKDGMEIILSEVVQCGDVMPMQRERWLATFCHCTVEVRSDKRMMAAAVSFASLSPGLVCCRPSVADRHAIHENMSEEERDELVITDAMYQAMGNPEYAPTWLKNKVNSMCPEELIKGRTIKPNQQLGTVMAMYGKQHEIKHELLQEKGLHMMIFQQNEHARLLSPWEVAAAMGFDSSTVLHRELSKSYTLVGNAINIAHAWMALYRTHIVLEDKSPFNPSGAGKEQVQKIVQKAMKLSDHVAIIQGEYRILRQVDQQHQSKKQKIEPTVAFTVRDPSEDEVLGTKHFHAAPCFVHRADPRQVAVEGVVYSNGILVLEHSQKHWVMFINFAQGDQVGQIVMRGLPHARPDHFQDMVIGGQQVEWETVLGEANMCTLAFVPVPSLVTCCEQSLNIALQLKCDVTWTVKTAISFCATKLGCNIDAVALLHKNIPMKDDDYILEYPDRQLALSFHACVPAYADLTPNAKGAQESIQPAPFSFTRFFARHPLKKITRTVAVALDQPISKVVQLLFPDLHANTPWSVFVDQEKIPMNVYASAYGRFTIQWDTLRPLRTTDVAAISYHNGLDSPATVAKLALNGIQRMLRNPFEVRPKSMMVRPDMKVGDVGAGFLCHSQINSSIMCTINGAVIDPEASMQSIDDQAIISFRLCPMLGGAKQDGLRKRIGDILRSRGVPDEVANERLADFLSKCPMEKISPFKDADDDELWKQLKILATNVRFRLIQQAELKAFQQQQRQHKNKAAGSGEGGPKKAKHEHRKDVQPKTPTAQEICVDPAHFAADDNPIAMLEVSRFGPDQSGLCIVDPSQATQMLQSQYKSCDPLALLVVGKGADKFGELITIPAHTKHGVPIVIAAALVQLGDVDIEFILRIPKIIVDQPASTVIEFTVEKAFVAHWGSTQIPLHYLGVHIPPLRGNNLLAVWSIKAYNNKQVCNHANASHWHGFFRVSDELLMQILPKSGNAGIFLCPKSASKRHDPRFVAIPLASGTLQEAIQKADGCDKALGVVRMGSSFAIRCKREDSACIRTQVMPETAFVEIAKIDKDDQLFILKHAPQINREALSDALQGAGWQAEAVKPQGINRWIIASQQDPPSSHLAINNCIVIIEKLNGEKKPAPSMLIATAREVKIDTVMEGNQVIQTTTTTRMAEMRAQIEEQVAAVMEAKMEQANSQIQELTQALHVAKQESASDLLHLKTEQEFTKQKLGEMEKAMTSSNQTILQQMKSMFTTMEQNMSAKMEQTIANMTPIEYAEKRHKGDTSEL